MIKNEFNFKNIKILRKRAGLTQQQLSEKLNIGRISITDWENGKRIPSIETLIKVSDALNCSIIEFFTTEISNTLSNEFTLDDYIKNKYDVSFLTRRKREHFINSIKEYIETEYEIARTLHLQKFINPATENFQIVGTYKSTDKLVFEDSKNNELYVLGNIENNSFINCIKLDSDTLEPVNNLNYTITALTKKENGINIVYDYRIIPDFSKFNKG